MSRRPWTGGGDVRAALKAAFTKKSKTGASLWAHAVELAECAGESAPWRLASLPDVSGLERFQAWVLRHGHPVAIRFRVKAHDGSHATFDIGGTGCRVVAGLDAEPSPSTLTGIVEIASPEDMPF